MSHVTADVEFDQAKGTVKFSLDLQGTTELDHELLAAAIGSGRSVSVVPAHEKDELFAEFTITDASIWPKAIRALQNRRRVADGLPTIEEEEKLAADRKSADANSEKEAIAARDKADAEAIAKQEAADARLAAAIVKAQSKSSSKSSA